MDLLEEETVVRHFRTRRARAAVRLFIETGRALWRHDSFSHAAEAAFSFALALFPALLLLVIAMGLLGQDPTLSGGFIEFLSRLMPAVTVQTIQEALVRLRPLNPHRDISLSLLFLLWPASGVFATYVKGTIVAYGAPDRRGWVRTRLLGVLLVLCTGGVMVAAFLSVAFAPLLARVFDVVGLGDAFVLLFRAIRFPLGIIMITPVLALLYRVGPDVSRREWHYPVWPGALFATLMWLTMSFGFSLYVERFGQLNATYGTLAGAILLLIWMYLTSLAVLLGAEFNVSYERFLRRWHGESAPAPETAPAVETALS